MRVAILGGSFDPIHNGHIQIAKTALKQLSIDEVWFMPAKSTPLKDRTMCAYTHRVQMIKRAIKPYRHMHVCTLEGELEGRSYTIRTVQELKRRYPQITFSWLIGADQALHFNQWKNYEQLKKEITFYVFSRQVEQYSNDDFQHIVMPLMNVSSTDIRNGQKWYMLPRQVVRYIGEHGLYIESIIQQRMREKRYLHSKSVADICVQLGELHGLDVNICYQMGMLHDISKEMPYEKAHIWMQHHMPTYLDTKPAIWHGYIGAYVVRHIFIGMDSHVAHAISKHVLGDVNNDYDRVLFIADKLDPLRGYDTNHQITLCKRDLKAGFDLVKKEQQTFLHKEGVIEEKR